MAKKKTRSELEEEMPFLAHLFELRDRLMHAVLAVLIVFLALFSFANDIYGIFAGPILRSLPEGGTMIATAVASPFLTPFKLTLVLSFYVAIPVILYQLWAFVAPGLYQHERKLVFPLLVSSILLFYAGVAFAYFIVMPMAFDFLVSFAPEGVSVTPDISQYLSFALTMFFAFGVAFEVPIATILLVWTGVATPESLASKRPYIIVGAFVIGMLLTPPDVISQTMLALPMWVLFEFGIIFSRMFVRDKKDNVEEEENSIGNTNTELATSSSSATSTHAHQDNETKEEKDEGLVFADEEENSYREMSEEEMEAELDRIEAEELAAAEKETLDGSDVDKNEEKDGKETDKNEDKPA